MSENSVIGKKPRFDFTAESLPEHPLFEGLDRPYRQILAECGMKADFEGGEKVATAGEPASGFYLVIRGAVDLENAHQSHLPASRVQTIRSGDVLGWSWLFPPYYWHFNAIAREPTRTIFFYGSRLRQQCDRNHDFGYELLKSMSQLLLAHMQADRERWIEAAHIAPNGKLGAGYLVI